MSEQSRTHCPDGLGTNDQTDSDCHNLTLSGTDASRRVPSRRCFDVSISRRSTRAIHTLRGRARPSTHHRETINSSPCVDRFACLGSTAFGSSSSSHCGFALPPVREVQDKSVIKSNYYHHGQRTPERVTKLTRPRYNGDRPKIGPYLINVGSSIEPSTAANAVL